MTYSEFVIALDQGTTSSRSLLFDTAFCIRGQSQIEINRFVPQAGWVEHDPEEIWQTTLKTARIAIQNGCVKSSQIAALGISNQRETTVIWHRQSGQVLYNAIGWQDRRTAPHCANLKRQGLEPTLTKKTGLLLDPYFSATKVSWILDSVEGARSAAEHGELAFGTIDSWLIWNLTGGMVHATDATNASRTMLYNIHEQQWDDDLLDIFNVPRALLPEVRDCNADFGHTTKDLFDGKIRLCGVAGDQQAAALGQACFSPGMLKSTYGTGCFALLNTGSKAVQSEHALITTIASCLDGEIHYALEGSIFTAGAAVNWLRDNLGIIASAKQSDDFARDADPLDDVYMVPAFTGLGAPWWDPQARGALVGLSLATTHKEITRAALESVCYQTLDLIRAMSSDWDSKNPDVMRVDGGMAASDWTLQFLADILQLRVDRPTITETSALGAAWLAASRAGIWPNQDGFSRHWQCEHRFLPVMDTERRDLKVAGWQRAIGRIKG
ncbi:MAG TPA: glycerol kinase [Porticoccaceae bacterium]|nr:glycerol kinase [Porticoccaceae bacterium]